MTYNVTIFEAKRQGKIPISPFDDKTFIFRTREVKNNIDFLRIIGKYFIMNQPFKDVGEEYDFRDYRRISSLKNKFCDVFNYIVLDVDNVNTKDDMNTIIDYFKNYKVILGESYSHNGIDNFRLKGVLFCEEGTIEQIQHSLNKIAEELRASCEIDTSRGFIPSFNAPARKNKIVFNNENGELWKHNQRLQPSKVPSKEVKKEIKVSKKIHNKKAFEEANSIKDISLMYFENLGFESIEANEDNIRFKHPSEVKSIGGFNWNPEFPYMMKHWNPERTIDAFDEINKIPRLRELIKETINYDSELLSYNPRTTLMKVNTKFLEITPDIQMRIEDFINSDNGIFSIRSPMGSGKSTVIKSIIDTAHDYGLRCLLITNRISVAEDFSEKYGIKLYNNNKSKYNKGDSLICQFDSLWKYDMRDFDLVIMDEFISIMSHSRSELNNSSLNIIKFFQSFNKKLVIADAFLTGYERFLLNDKVESNSFLLDNDYRDGTILHNYHCKNQFVLKLLHTAREQKITVSSTSLRFLEDVRSLLNDNGVRTMSLTADTPEHTKELIYGTFKEDHDKYDVLLYSPTLTVGVSNLNTIYEHFHFDSSNSADVISSLQMMKRTRKAKEIHMFIADSFKYLETDYQKLRSKYLNNVGKLGDFSILFEVNEYGDVQISEVGKKVLKIDIFKNVLETNHKGAMLWLMKYHFKNEPREITKQFNSNILLKYTRENRINSSNQQKELIKEFLNLSEVQKVSDTGTNTRKLSEIHECLNLRKLRYDINEDKIKEGILNIAIKDSSFIEKCRYFYLMKSFLEGTLSKNDIKYRMQKFIGNSEIDKTTFCSNLIKLNIEFSTEYELKELRDRNLNYVTKRCGYEKAQSLGRRYMKINSNVLKYYKYISEF